MELFRIKFTLADGREVYATDAGGYQMVGPDALGTPVVRKLIDQGAYTTNLSAFIIGASGPGYVRITGAVVEPASSPVDTHAFVLGGMPAA